MVFAGVRLETAVFAALTAAAALADDGMADLAGHVVLAEEHLAVHDVGAEHSHAYMEKGEAVRAFLRGKEIFAKSHTACVVFIDDGKRKLLLNPFRVEILPCLPVGHETGGTPVHMARNRGSDSNDFIPGNAGLCDQALYTIDNGVGDSAGQLLVKRFRVLETDAAF